MASFLSLLLDLSIVLITITECLDEKLIAIPSEHEPHEDSSDVVSSANSKSTRRLMQNTTPAPTVPENITCTDESYFVSGDYNDELLSFYIQVNYPGAITIDARNSTADNGNNDIIGLELHFPDGTTITDGDNDPGVPGDQYPDDFLLFSVVNLEKGNYRLDYFIDYPPPQGQYGTFALSVRCDATPTTQPTPAPTSYPTVQPTPRPTKFPLTSSPTVTPTTVSPTTDPTSLPTASPMTRAPSISPSVYPTSQPTLCEDQCNGYNPICCENTMDNFDNPCLAECFYGTEMWRIDGYGFRCYWGRCDTADPTKDPTMDPTKYLTVDLTTDPTSHPISAPTESPTPMPKPTSNRVTNGDTNSGAHYESSNLYNIFSHKWSVKHQYGKYSD